MANTINSTYMVLPVPIVGQDPGPTYAYDINNCLTIIDAHDHTPGSGVQITPSGLNINADLSLNNNNLISARTLRLQIQGSTPGTLSDLTCLYVTGVDLYYIDGAGNNVRITQSGGVAGSPGSIANLTSPASASYVSANSTFVWQSAASTAASMDAGSYILRNLTASSFGLTLSPPTLGSDYTIVLPALPGSTSAVNMTSSGSMGTITYDGIGQTMSSVGANAIGATSTRATGTTVGVGGIAIAGNTGIFSVSSTGFLNVTNQDIILTTSGKPIKVRLEASGVGTASMSYDAGVAGDAIVQLLINGSATASWEVVGTAGNSYPFAPGGIAFTHVAGAGTYEYQLQAKTSSVSNTLNIINCRLIAEEYSW